MKKKNRKKGPFVTFMASTNFSMIKAQYRHLMQHLGPWRKSGTGYVRLDVEGFSNYWVATAEQKSKLDKQLLKEGFILHGKVYA